MVGALKGEGWNPLTNYVINSLNILLKCLNVSKKRSFQNKRAIECFYFQFIAEKNDRLKLCENSETLV